MAKKKEVFDPTPTLAKIDEIEFDLIGRLELGVSNGICTESDSRTLIQIDNKPICYPKTAFNDRNIIKFDPFFNRRLAAFLFQRFAYIYMIEHQGASISSFWTASNLLNLDESFAVCRLTNEYGITHDIQSNCFSNETVSWIDLIYKMDMCQYPYKEFYELDQNGEKQMFWATGNAGFALSQLDNSGPDQFPSYRADNGFNGKCACLQTLSTGVFGQAMHKPIAAGNLFLGKFIVEYAASESLKATAFGLPWDKEPVRVTGYYKYKPGKEVINYMEEVIPDRTDEASAYAVFYRNLDEKGEKYTLDGEAVSELDKLMDNPQVYKVARVPALPPTDQWRHFEMFFEGKDAPDDMVAKKEFSLAIVFSSSVRGAWFEGAIGSTLYVDEVEVSYEK